MFGVVKSDILADRIQVALGTARGVGTIPHTGHDAGDHRGQGQSPSDEQNTAGSTTGFTRQLVSDKKAETEAGHGLGESDGPAYGEIL
jgi:hypothetical protein